MDQLLKDIRSCTLCAEHLPLGPNPVITVSPQTKILIIGQAPGTKVHASGIPWDDLSGRALRRWLGVDSNVFYNSGIFGVMAMGMCYPVYHRCSIWQCTWSIQTRQCRIKTGHPA